MASGTAQTRYSGTQTITTSASGNNYILSDPAKKIYTRDANNLSQSGYPYISNYTQFTDNDNNWTTAEHSSGKDNAALDAHWGATKTYDYFLSAHNRNSYDGNGAQIRSYVHVDNNLDNAFWNGSVMSYGDGSSNGNEGSGYFDALTSIDVAAHEIGHAVCEYTADLAYQRESGAMNEGFSDIWAAVVENYAAPNDPNKNTWLIGEEIDRRSGSTALRSMSNPKSLSQPDTYLGTYWKNVNCGTPVLANDYCGVHTNSGVLNYWFYVLAQGDAGTNDVGDVYDVAGIGINKAAQIAYRLESVYLSSNSNFANARTYGIQAAEDLYGADSPEVIAVTNAWYAVNVGDAYNGGGNPPTGDCAENDVVLTITFDNYPEETSWVLRDADGTTVASKQYSSSNADGSTVTENLGTLDAGDYTFTISDTYGDGICCSYGNGSYTLSSGSLTIKSGGDFGNSEATNFCIEGNGGDTQAPTAPTNLTYSNVAITSASLSWTAAADNVGVTGYQVFQGGSIIGTVTGNSANITGLTADTNYTFSVRAIDEAGNQSNASNSVTFRTLQETSNPNCHNENVILTIVTDRYPRETSWTLKNASGTTVASRAAGTYTTRYATYNHTFSGLAAGDYTFTINDTYGDGMCCTYGNGSYTLKSGSTTVVSGGNYGSSQSTTYCINASSNVNYSAVQDFGEEVKEVQHFKISPNPANTFAELHLEDAKDGATYQVYDQAGKVVKSGDLKEKRINVQALQSGAYIIKVFHGNEIYTEKLIKK